MTLNEYASQGSSAHIAEYLPLPPLCLSVFYFKEVKVPVVIVVFNINLFPREPSVLSTEVLQIGMSFRKSIGSPHCRSTTGFALMTICPKQISYALLILSINLSIKACKTRAFGLSSIHGSL